VRSVQDIQGPPIEADANLFCHVAFQLHVHCTVDSKSAAVQSIRAGQAAVSEDDTAMQLLCRLPHSR
jgi:hypothetical protein